MATPKKVGQPETEGLSEPKPTGVSVTHRFLPTDGQFYPGLPDRDLTSDDHVDQQALRRAIAEGIFEPV